MAKVTFAGIDLMEDTEGNFSYLPGVIGRDREFIKLGRAEGLITKDLGSSGAEHVVSLNYKAIDNFAGIMTRLQNACERDEGSLQIEGYSTVNNCVVAAKPAIGPGSYSSLITGTREGYAFSVQIVFVQTD